MAREERSRSEGVRNKEREYTMQLMSWRLDPLTIVQQWVCIWEVITRARNSDWDGLIDENIVRWNLRGGREEVYKCSSPRA